MKTPVTDATMSPEAFSQTLEALGWKQSDFCRKTGVSKDTPSRWAKGQTPIPLWVGAYLGAMLDLSALYQRYLAPTSPVTSAAAPSPAPSRLAHLLPANAPSAPDS